jgi:hypothetical protein
MVKHSRVNDTSGLIITDRVNENFGFLSVNPPELTISSQTIDLADASVASNVYSVDPASNVSLATIVGGVVGEIVTLVNISSNNVTVLATDNIKGMSGSIILYGAYSNITFKKVDTTSWVVISNSGEVIPENIFHTSYGNAKDGSGASSDAEYTYGTDQVMGGEYWFDHFEINTDIQVNSAIGWLVIRANTIEVTKPGGALINGEGKSRSQGSAGTARVMTNGGTSESSLKTIHSCFGVASQGGTGGTGEIRGNEAVVFTTGSAAEQLASGLNTNSKNIPATAGRTIQANGDHSGNNGVSAENVPIDDFNTLLTIPINYGGGGTGGTGGCARGNEAGAPSEGTDGGDGGAGICLFAKNLVLTENLSIVCDGTDSTTPIGTEGGGDGQGGSGGGGGAGSSVVAYLIKSGNGTLSQSAEKGVAGATGAGGGKGGDGGDGLTIVIDDFAKTIDINGSGMLPA